MKWKIKCGLYTIEYYAVLKKEGNPVTFCHMDAPQRHHAKQSNLVTEEWTMCDFTKNHRNKK